MTVTGISNRSSGVTRALKISATYLLTSIPDVRTIQNRSFSSQPLAFPEPNDPMRKRMKRKEVGEDWKTPARE